MTIDAAALHGLGIAGLGYATLAAREGDGGLAGMKANKCHEMNPVFIYSAAAGSFVDNSLAPASPCAHGGRMEGARESGWTDLWRKDDWLSVWIGFLILGAFLAGLTLELPGWKWTTFPDLAGVFAGPNLLRLVPPFLGFLAIGAAATALLRRGAGRFLAGFPVMFVLAAAAFLIAGNTSISAWGLEYVLCSLLLGLLIGNTVGLPAWLRAAANTELYVKIGLVLLGAELLLPTLLKAGA